LSTRQATDSPANFVGRKWRVRCKKYIRNMRKPAADPRTVEEVCLADLERIEREISALQKEKEYITRVLARARQQNADLKDVTRKNSINRVLIESAIIRIIGESRPPVSAKRLNKMLSEIRHNMPDVTLRSYLFRMKQKGLIASAGRGAWTLPPKSQRP
jgi:hypothetical protein